MITTMSLPKNCQTLQLVPKTYWSILKTFYNTKRVPIIPPILVENKLETDFLNKANYFDKF